MKLIIISLVIGAWAGGEPVAPDTVDLEYCYERIQTHYPLARKIELQQKITDLQVKLAHTGYYPRLDLGGTASYQSEVTELPGGPGGISAPFLSKDHYKVSLDIAQPVYNGGAVAIRKNLQEETGRQEQISTEVQLHEIYTQVNQVYFNILLAKQQARIIALLIENLEARLNMVRSRVENGILLPSQQYVLQAELIKARQDSSETHSNIRAGYKVLGELIGRELPASVVLEVPQISYEKIVALPPERPELQLFKNTKDMLEYRKRLEDSKKSPKISIFGTAAYGRPGYNFFNNDFHGFYMVGARIQWNFWDWNNSAEEKQILTLQQQKVDKDRLAFNRRLAASLDRIEEQIISLREQIRYDKEILALREKIVKESASQLANGVMTATEYVTELNRFHQAQSGLYAHQIRLARMKVKYAITKGVSIKNEK